MQSSSVDVPDTREKPLSSLFQSPAEFRGSTFTLDLDREPNCLLQHQGISKLKRHLLYSPADCELRD